MNSLILRDGDFPIHLHNKFLLVIVGSVPMIMALERELKEGDVLPINGENRLRGRDSLLADGADADVAGARNANPDPR